MVALDSIASTGQFRRPRRRSPRGLISPPQAAA